MRAGAATPTSTRKACRRERSADPLLIAEEFAVLDEPVLLFDSVAEALEAALAVADETDLIVVTGSLYTVADAHRALGEPF